MSKSIKGAKPKLILDVWKVALCFARDSFYTLPDLQTRVIGRIRNRDYRWLSKVVEHEAEYQHSWETVVQLRQLAAFFKKNEAFSDQTECTASAVESFLDGEKNCRITNKRLLFYYENEDRLSPSLRRWVKRWQRLCSQVLGDPSLFLDQIPELIRITPGATQDRTRSRALPFLKITGKLKAPLSTRPLLDTLLRFNGVDPSGCKHVNVDWNVVVCVPKNCFTHRVIAKEPTHALPFQLAFDAYAKRRLKTVLGINLSDQSLSQELARKGSLDGSYATLDLKNASNSNSLSCVALGLEPEWFELLSSIRSRRYVFPEIADEIRPYAMFSSMGNGCTFTLETLFFAAACMAVGAGRNDYTVYGDDIVIKTQYASDVTQLLKYLGFQTNKDKTFIDPECPFRESCGCDWLSGRLVTPVYLRSAAIHLSDIVHGVNSLLGVAVPGGSLWDYLIGIAKDTRLPKVPFNEDSRSGVWLTPHEAHSRGLLFYPRPSGKGAKRGAPGWTPFYKGFDVVPIVRYNHGWRSLLLWFVEKRSSAVVSRAIPSRLSELLLQGSTPWVGTPVQSAIDRLVGISDCRETTRTTVGFRTVHAVRKFVPALVHPPHHLFLVDEALRER